MASARSGTKRRFVLDDDEIRTLFVDSGSSSDETSSSDDSDNDLELSDHDFGSNSGVEITKNFTVSDSLNEIESRTTSRPSTEIEQFDQNIEWKWEEKDNNPEIFAFRGQPGCKLANLNENSSALEIFREFLYEDLCLKIVEETNRYAHATTIQENPAKKRHNVEWFDLSSDELNVFLAVTILMGIVHKPEIDMYWSRDPKMETPFFRDTMPRDRYTDILRKLHFNNNENDDGTDRLFKIRPVVDGINEKFKAAYTPSQDISIDESLKKFHGRLGFKQFNPSKRARFGIKFYKLNQSKGPAAGYTWNFKIYTGQDTDASNTPASTKVVLDLSQDLLGFGYNIFVDNWYSSPDLFTRLIFHHTNACGTVRLNRKNIPRDISNENLKRGDITFRSSNNILLLVWKDKKEVKMLTTMHNAEMVDTGKIDWKTNLPIVKPACVLSYNNGMGGTDRSDQLAANNKSVRKHVKWYKKLFYYLLDLVIINSFLLHKSLDGKSSLLQFKQSLVSQLIETSRIPIYRSRGRPRSLPSPLRLQGRHFPTYIAATEKKKYPTKRCEVCSKRGLRSESRYMCETCEIPLCVVPCFKDFHAKSNYCNSNEQ